MLGAAFYLNKLTLPPVDREMTAYETSERIKEYIRGSRPIWEPMEHEYNYGVCDTTFETLMENGAFGSPYDMPRSLQGREVRFKFRGPLHDAVERQDAVTFLEAKQLIREAHDLDPTAAMVFDARQAVRDALEGIRARSRWIRPREQVERMAEEMAVDQQVQQKAATVAQAAQAAAVLREGIG
jgi:hypothetical protein